MGVCVGGGEESFSLSTLQGPDQFVAVSLLIISFNYTVYPMFSVSFTFGVDDKVMPKPSYFLLFMCSIFSLCFPKLRVQVLLAAAQREEMCPTYLVSDQTKCCGCD